MPIRNTSINARRGSATGVNIQRLRSMSRAKGRGSAASTRDESLSAPPSWRATTVDCVGTGGGSGALEAAPARSSASCQVVGDESNGKSEAFATPCKRSGNAPRSEATMGRPDAIAADNVNEKVSGTCDGSHSTSGRSIAIKRGRSSDSYEPVAVSFFGSGSAAWPIKRSVTGELVRSAKSATASATDRPFEFESAPNKATLTTRGKATAGSVCGVT